MTTYFAYTPNMPTSPFTLSEMQETRQMYVVKAAKLGVDWARVYMYRDTPEWREYANSLPCGTQDAKGDEQECRYNDYLRVRCMVDRIDAFLKENDCSPANGLADDILASVDRVIDEIFRGECHHDTFNMVLDYNASTLARLSN